LNPVLDVDGRIQNLLFFDSRGTFRGGFVCRQATNGATILQNEMTFQIPGIRIVLKHRLEMGRVFVSQSRNRIALDRHFSTASNGKKALAQDLVDVG
jgi:hypothetical protein